MNTITTVDLLNISIQRTKIKHQVLSNIIIVLGCFYIVSGSLCGLKLHVFHTNSFKIIYSDGQPVYYHDNE